MYNKKDASSTKISDVIKAFFTNGSVLLILEV
jgi:hypothetical protein